MRHNLIAQNAYIRKKEKFQISNLSSYIKNVEKEEWYKPNTNRRKEIIEIKEEISEINKNGDHQWNTVLVLWKY